jgi:hypothetical protein
MKIAVHNRLASHLKIYWVDQIDTFIGWESRPIAKLPKKFAEKIDI